jgi:hypothetical protein
LVRKSRTRAAKPIKPVTMSPMAILLSNTAAPKDRADRGAVGPLDEALDACVVAIAAKQRSGHEDEGE